MTLAETQDLLREAITAPSPLAPARLEACIAGTPDLPAAARVAIYRDMYRARLHEALRQTFPALARRLGEEDFAALAGDYLAAHPSEHHDVGQVGRLLPAFLQRFPDPERPGLADLAALEWARQEAFFAPAAPAAGAGDLARLAGEALAGARLGLAPSLRLLRLEQAVGPLWRALTRGEAAPAPEPGPSALAVWRSGFEVFHAALPADEAEALATAAAGGSLAEVCAALAGRADPAAEAHRVLSGWLAEGWVAGVHGPAEGDAARQVEQPPGGARRHARSASSGGSAPR